MLLTELVLHNVGPYRGRQRIDLSTRPGRPVLLIGGLNGCGKTTLLDALQLALYGNRARVSNRGSQAYEDFLASTISRGVDPKDGASVTLCFELDMQGEHQAYQVVRSWAAAGKRIRESLDVSVNGHWSETLSSTWADHVEDLLPLELSGLFFFDGEKIEALADPERSAAVIETAVHSLLGASTLEQLRVDLASLQRRQVPSTGDARLEQAFADTLAEHDRLGRDIALCEQRLESAHEDASAARALLADAEAAFAAEGGDVYLRRADLAGRLRASPAQKAQLDSQLRGLAEGLLPLLLVNGQLEQVVQQARLEDRTAESRRLVELLEARDLWLTDQLSAGDAQQVQLLLAADRRAREVQLEADTWLALSPERAQELQLVPGRLQTDRDSLRLLLDTAASCQAEVEQLEDLLGQVPSEERIAERQRALQSAQSSLARSEGQLELVQADRERLVRDREANETKLARIEAERLSLNVADEDKRRVVEHADKAREVLAALKQRLIARNIGRIEVATLESFRRLMRKSGLVADLRIDPRTYSVALYTSNGDHLPPSRLSAGERQLLAVALLWGLTRVAGNQLPMVIDTPLGRLDSVHRQYLVERYFPNAGAQVLLLSTDEEIEQGLLPVLAPAISAAYLLEHDADNDRTAIRPGYWWPLEVEDVA